MYKAAAYLPHIKEFSLCPPSSPLSFNAKIISLYSTVLREAVRFQFPLHLKILHSNVRTKERRINPSSDRAAHPQPPFTASSLPTLRTPLCHRVLSKHPEASPIFFRAEWRMAFDSLGNLSCCCCTHMMEASKPASTLRVIRQAIG